MVEVIQNFSVKLVTIQPDPFQIPQMVRVTGAFGLYAVSPVGMATRSEPGHVATHALLQNPGHVTVPTAQVGFQRSPSH